MPATAAAAAMAPAATANDSTADIATEDIPTYIQVANHVNFETIYEILIICVTFRGTWGPRSWTTRSQCR